MDSTRLETVPPGPVNLDTVRALHQTVVSLRTALEVSKNELKDLKQKYELHSQCLEYADVIEKLTLENHILRRKIIDTGDEKDFNPNINFQVTYSPRTDTVDRDSEILIQTTTENLDTKTRIESDICCSEIPNTKLSENSKRVSYCSIESSDETPLEVKSQDPSEADGQNTDVEISRSSSCLNQENEKIHQPSFKTKLELLSKFDVRIKVKTVKDGESSSTTSDTDSTFTDDKKNKDKNSKGKFEFQEKKEDFERAADPKKNTINFKSVSSDNITMAVPNPEGDVKSKKDKLVQVRITSEENLIFQNMKDKIEQARRKDTLNLDVDDLSVRSLSEGDNSVFSEGATTPMDPQISKEDYKQEHDASGNESEEVDDIELIFTTDESKDMSNLQEDLVPIRETDHWTPHSNSTTHSTPVLIKFHTLDPDFQPGTETTDNNDNENQENCSLQSEISMSSLKMKRVSLPSDKEIRHVAFNSKGSLDIPGRSILKSCDNKSDNTLYKKSPNTSSKKLDSIDSLTCEYNRGLSFDNTKSSSFELGSSMDILHRDESVESFYKTAHLGHRFSVFAETDISKCGISEDDLAVNLNARRNTCPNPFQYRVPTHRGYSRGVTSGPVRARPVLRDVTAPRRDSAAQTDVSALPPRWSSDGYLAHKMYTTSAAAAPTLPQRGLTPNSRRGAAESRVPAVSRRCSEARRVLLSDIGFTSMVPELSRSADPVWALTKKMSSIEETVTNSTSKFLSRGSSYRSPAPSLDRSRDWTPPRAPPSAGYRPWRSSLPDVRRDDTEELLEEAEIFLRRSIDNLRPSSPDVSRASEPRPPSGRPYIPAEPRELRLGHAVKFITPQGRVAVGRVRYVGIAGGASSVTVGAELQCAGPPHNDGTVRDRRYFLAAPRHTAVFVPFSKVVMAWAN
ncbi:uncharacterized protein LOC114251971 [Bombyx mandarina]|uniref:Uncharacterized protein LOC114251971 n=1 Tax=Bombyx mandarina TaxID=7092 RepID=A0A6J2KL05_BOMMA|nr:uncharacterized protein LOC114251971 [Bombyx mandarina]XP_028042238.1 uncharacterized protein LOC114251971 [Bombyx mandarina]